jgi:hypothetical protein
MKCHHFTDKLFFSREHQWLNLTLSSTGLSSYLCKKFSFESKMTLIKALSMVIGMQQNFEKSFLNFSRSCHNYLGKLCTTNPVKVGTISSVVLNDIPLVFHRAETSSVASSIDDRFNYFVQVMYLRFKKQFD